MKFVDGFGDHRLFCRTCGRSFLLEETLIVDREQKNLQEFNPNHLVIPMSR
jgi:hypothetical protein